MKLITAIVNKEDSKNVCNELLKSKFYVTRLATTGGFLMAGNMTLLICTDDERVDDCIDIISKCCKQRTEIVPGTATLANLAALLCYYLMGCAAIAIGVFLSSLTENQIIAAVSGVAALLLAYMMPSLRTMFTTGSAVALALFTAIAAVLSVVAGLRSKSFTLGCLSFAGCCVALTALFLLKSSWLTEAFSAVLNALCLFIPFEEFVNSSFSIPTLVYYLTVAAVFLFFTAQGLEKRRWN